MSTVTYVTDDNSPLTPNASLVLSRMGDDAEEAWAAQRRWIRPQGAPADPCSAPGCDRDAISHGLCLKHYRRARGKHADEPAPMRPSTP